MKTEEMTRARKTANEIENIEERAGNYSEIIRPFMDEIRYHTDKLELIVDDEIWPLPKYRELLFTH
jgi:glutamine synthetase